MNYSVIRKIFFLSVVMSITLAGTLAYTSHKATYTATTDAISLPYSDVSKKDIVLLQATSSPAIKIQNLPGPRSLVIPSLSINAKIERVGVNSKGNMATPKSFGNVGWYGAGPMPGENGNAVISGHLDNGLGLSGVFKNLKQINVGDVITIVDDKGLKTDFSVTHISLYDFESSSDQIFTSEDGGSHLVLLTCEGMWLPDSKTYDKRLVVFADKVAR